ncbi:MAG: putative 4-mercaptohistidine N1-methyltransferase [Gloeobacteraceae cyanobacterium ES-bin-144]|nr:putative 4-mercaptohistidine N1-methyltransferase [Verrucomicrobiales bacterium]
MSSIYESEKLLAEYLLFHYGTADEILPPGYIWPEGMITALDFPVRTVGHFKQPRVARGLDLGCAVGRSSFEMTRFCDEVTGIDFSHAFIRTAEALRSGETLDYARLEEGNLLTRLAARMPEGLAVDNLHFKQGDAMNLPEDIGPFDRVHAANLLCRLSEPEKLLVRLPGLVKPGGELVLATPCSWLEEFTPIKNWPACSTIEWLKESLENNFSLVTQTEEPFLIRETARKFQWSRSLVTVWQRIS